MPGMATMMTATTSACGLQRDKMSETGQGIHREHLLSAYHASGNGRVRLDLNLSKMLLY